MRYSQAKLLLACVLPLVTCGCLVPQPAGQGKMSYRREASTGAGYYLYLPQDYVESEGNRPPGKKWPIVVTYHGMRPFDSAGAQIKEWQQEADRYGYVVVAPDTRISDLLGEIPLRRVNHSLKRDEKASLAILDELSERLDVDPNHVLSTSWSMGGYLAHYMINRYPERFSCLAVKQSTFAAEILDEAMVPRYRDHKIAIFYTENDLGNCRKESKQAIQWYTAHGFDTTSGVVAYRGHERMPELAAAFFAKTCGAEPKTPPTQLAHVLIKTTPGRQTSHVPGNSPALASASGTNRQQPPAPPQRQEPMLSRGQLLDEPKPQAASETPRNPGAQPTENQVPPRTAPRPTQLPAGPERPAQTRQLPPRNSRTLQDVWHTRNRIPRDTRQTLGPNPLKVRLSATIGISPMLLSYTVHMPGDLMKGADVLWLDNDEPISHGISGQRSLTTPGQHRIEVLVVTRDNREYRASKKVTVLQRLPLSEDD